MSQPLLLTYDSKTIGVVRNPYERLVALYQQSFDFIGFDNWIVKSKPELQTVLFKDCDYIIRFEAWEDELKFHNLHPKDTSILKSLKVNQDWKNWYTLRTRTMIAELYHNDIVTYGYSY